MPSANLCVPILKILRGDDFHLFKSAVYLVVSIIAFAYKHGYEVHEKHQNWKYTGGIHQGRQAYPGEEVLENRTSIVISISSYFQTSIRQKLL